MSVKVDLKFPIDDGGTGIGTLSMRRPKVRDMLSSNDKDLSDAENEVRLFANLCDIPPNLLEELDIADYRALQTAYSGFLS